MTGASTEFIAKYTATVYPDARDEGIEMWLSEAGGAAVCIEAIWSHAERGSGRASNALRRLCEFADRHSIALHAVVHPLAYGEMEGEPPEQAAQCDKLDAQALNNKQLEAWYARLGFRRIAGADPWNPQLVREAAPVVVPSGGRPATLDPLNLDSQQFVRIGAIPAGEYQRTQEAGKQSPLQASPEQIKLRNWAAGHQHDNYIPGDKGYCPAKTADWHLDENFPVSALKHLVKDWDAWFREEVEMDEEGAMGRNWRRLLHEDIREDVVILVRDGKGYIWDGWHRVAATIVSGRETIKALVGVPKPQLKSNIDEVATQGADADIPSTPSKKTSLGLG